MLPTPAHRVAPHAPVADMTCVPTWTGFFYLAVVLDVWSRRIVGYNVAAP